MRERGPVPRIPPPSLPACGVASHFLYTSDVMDTEMTSDDLLPMIWDALGDDLLTTKEATDRLEHLFEYRCPDDLAKTLMKYRKAGKIKGQISMDRGGWVWWADEECRRS